MPELIGPARNMEKVPAIFQDGGNPEVHYLESKENGQVIAHGEPAQILLNSGFNLNLLRPYMAWNGKRFSPYVKIGDRQVIVNNEAVKKPIIRPATNATLRTDEWKSIDMAVLETAKQRLRFYQTMAGAGLTYPLSDAMGTTVLGWDKMTDDDGDARLTMTPDIAPPEGRVEYTREYIPIPLICKGFRLNVRELNASRTTGRPLDTTIAADAARKVMEAVEKLCLLGTGAITYGGGTLYGAINYTNRVTGSLTGSWATTPANAKTDTLAMKQASLNINHFGPWSLFTPTNFETALDEDYNASYPSRTVRERVMSIEGITNSTTLDYLTASNVLMMEMNQASSRIIVGFEPRTLQWTGMGSLALYYMIMCCIVPNFRADANNRCGIIHYS